MTATMSYDDYLRLIGLLTLARDHNRALEDIRLSALQITNERDDNGAPDLIGHTSDAIYGECSVDQLLRNLGFTVELVRPNTEEAP